MRRRRLEGRARLWNPQDWVRREITIALDAGRVVVPICLNGAGLPTNPDLGAPFHQQLFDFPVGLDNLNLLGLKVLGAVFGDVGTTVNMFFVLTFAAVAVSMLPRAPGAAASSPSSSVVALLYAFLPYHFARGVPHLFLSSYWVVPLAVYLILRVVSDRPPVHPETRRRRAVGGVRRVRRGSGMAVAARVRRDRVVGRVLRRVHRCCLLVVLARRRLRRPPPAARARVGRDRDRRHRRGGGRSTSRPRSCTGPTTAPTTAVVRRLPVRDRGRGPQDVAAACCRSSTTASRRSPTSQADEHPATRRCRASEGQQLGVIGALGFVGAPRRCCCVAIRRRAARTADGAGDDDGARPARCRRPPRRC